MKKLIATAAALLMLGAVATTAFADNAAGLATLDSTISFESIMYLTDDAVSPPDITFTYTLKAASGGSFIADDGSTGTIETGVMPYDDDDDEQNRLDSIVETAVFSTTDYVAADNTTSTEDNTVSKTISFDAFNASEFPDAGIYHYTLTETCSDYDLPGLIAFNDNEDVDGDDPDTFETHLYITVEYQLDGNNEYALAIAGYRLTAYAYSDPDEAEENSTYAGKMSSFEHGYGTGTVILLGVDSVFNYSVSVAIDGLDFVVTDTAFGTWANRSKSFSFTMTTSDIPDGTVFAVLTANSAATPSVTGSSDQTATTMSSTPTEDAQTSLYTTIADDGITSILSAQSYEGQTLQYIMVDNGSVYWATRSVNSETDDVSFAQGSEATFSLSDGQAFRVLSVIEGMTFTVTIADPEESDDGYSFYARDYYPTDTTDETDGNGEMSASFDVSNALLVAASATAVVDPVNIVPVSFVVENNIIYSEYANSWYYLRATGDDSFTKHDSNTSADTWEYTMLSYDAYNSFGQDNSAPQQVLSATAQDSSYITLALSDGYAEYATDYWQGIDFGTVKGLDDTAETDPSEMTDLGIVYDVGLPDTGVVLDLAPYVLILLLVASLGSAKVYITRKHTQRAERGDEQ